MFMQNIQTLPYDMRTFSGCLQSVKNLIMHGIQISKFPTFSAGDVINTYS